MNLVSHSSHVQLSARNSSVQDLSNPDNPGNATTDTSSVSTQLAAGNSGEAPAKIQPSILKSGNRKTPKKQKPGNKTLRASPQAQLASGNRRGPWTLRWIFTTWKLQTINTWRRSVNSTKKKFQNWVRNIWFGSNEDQCVDVGTLHVFIDESSHPSWTELHRELGCIRENTNFGRIQHLFFITVALILEYSEEILNVKTIESTSPAWRHCSMIRWYDGQKKKCESTQIPCFVCLIFQKQMADGKVKWNNSKMSFFCRIAGNWWRSNWIRVEYSPEFTSLQILQEIQDHMQ